MGNKTPVFIFIGALVAMVLYNSIFFVYEWEKAIRLQFGEIIESDYEPGAYGMIPVINDIRKFDARLRTLDVRPERFLTIEKKDVIVDSYVKWQISDVAQYYRSTGGNADRAASLLAERINTALRDEFGQRTIKEVVSGDRVSIMKKLTEAADTQGADLGVDVVDVRIKQINLPPEVSDSVYGRMRAERERVARDLRAKGGEQAEIIRAEADRQKVVIKADAYSTSEQLRGEGEGVAAKTYADAFNSDADFYAFWRSLTAYRKSMTSGNDIMVLEPDSDFFRYFNKQ